VFEERSENVSPDLNWIIQTGPSDHTQPDGVTEAARLSSGEPEPVASLWADQRRDVARLPQPIGQLGHATFGQTRSAHRISPGQSVGRSSTFLNIEGDVARYIWPPICICD